ncbi:hypothetical protein MAR_027171 [Mya arenaria]|uniref:Uncharacterized protein n=1 Tax=Mya arenaria TaxID=6604 RepID=A0ABY7EVZ3_MYAAR|nr:hypothetical protein MAR_027171 [Mya arenaria]
MVDKIEVPKYDARHLREETMAALCKEFGNIEQVHTAGEREVRFEEVDARLHHRDQLNMIGCTQHILDIEAD